MVEEPSGEEAVEWLRGLRPRFEQHHGVLFTPDSLHTAVQAAQRYISERCGCGLVRGWVLVAMEVVLCVSERASGGKPRWRRMCPAPKCYRAVGPTCMGWVRWATVTLSRARMDARIGWIIAWMMRACK
jgi:hypothetical protein